MTPPAVARPARRKPIIKRLCMTVLIMEAVVIGLAIPVAIQIDHLAPRSAGWAGGVAVAAAVIFAGLTRPLLTAALVGGTLLQVFVIVSGTIVPVMYFLGAIFAALWIIGIVLGRSIDRPASP
jgi:Protein of unknown function (DUF4233)